MSEEKGEVLRIRCSKELLDRFKKFAGKFKNYEQALTFLMNWYEGKLSKAPIRTYVGVKSEKEGRRKR